MSTISVAALSHTKVCTAQPGSGETQHVEIHPGSPGAGIQVPANTVEAGESLNDAILREVREEIGLRDLNILSFLGVREYDMSPFGKVEIYRRHFYHVSFLREAPPTWVHYETSEGQSEPITFEFLWTELPNGVLDLIAG